MDKTRAMVAAACLLAGLCLGCGSEGPKNANSGKDRPVPAEAPADKAK